MNTKPLIESILDIFKELFPTYNQNHPLALHEPSFVGNEWKYVKDCLDTGWVSSAGSYVDQFESLLATYTGAKHAIAVVNGTAALHACLIDANVCANDEVIIPTLSFVATANVVSYCNAFPIFADCNKSNLGIDHLKLAAYLNDGFYLKNSTCINKKTGRVVKAMLVMHTFGHPGDLDELNDLCNRWNITLIEDAAESLGSFYKGRHVGNHGKTAAISFNGNKTITTGGGGAILTNDTQSYNYLKHITTTAKLGHKWAFFHDQTGYNYRLPNINAALGCAQIENIDFFLKNKRLLSEKYFESFSPLSGIKFLKESEDVRSNYWLNAVILDEKFSNILEPLIQTLHLNGFMVRPVWTPLHKLPMYEKSQKTDLSVAESLHRRIINLPSSQHLLTKV